MCPAVTRATGEFWERCGWPIYEAVPSKQSCESCTVDRADSPNGTAQLVHCKLVVGRCQLSTVLQIVDNVDFSDRCGLSRWHIHIGSEDFEALQRDLWDLDICYLPVKPNIGQLGSPPDCPLSCSSFFAALRHGHPDCLSHRHMFRVNHHRREQDWHRGPHFCNKAAGRPTAEWLVHKHDVLGLPWDAGTCAAAAKYGSIDCLSYAHASGCPWNSKTCVQAARYGNLQCLMYAHEHGCTWGIGTLHNAACNGHLECLKYAYTHGCPFDAGRPADLPWCITRNAVRGSSMPCLVYVRETMGCEWDPKGSECTLAFQKGELELLQYIHSHGGVLCTPFELLCPDSDKWLEDSGNDADKKAMCLMYVLCYGGCQVKSLDQLRRTYVGSLALGLIKARRVAVLLSFHAAGKACVGGPLLTAAHAVMQRMPGELIQEFICAAGLQVLE